MKTILLAVIFLLPTVCFADLLTQDPATFNKKFAEIFEMLDVPQACHAVDSTLIEPCLTQNIDAIKEALKHQRLE